MRFKEFLEKEYVIGIDLHGTLLNKEWVITPNSLSELIVTLNKIKPVSYIFICSGNDLSFTRKVLPLKLRELIDGFILENGCVFSDGIEERLLITNEQAGLIKKLQQELKYSNLPDVLFFASRSGTISLFTKERNRGTAPYDLFNYLENYLKTHPDRSEIFLTHSDVAVDILPAGNSKYVGLNKICPHQNIIAVADSCNDWEFLDRAWQKFMPVNCCSHLEKKFSLKGYQINSLDTYLNGNNPSTVYKSSFSYTEGVLEILTKLAEHL